MTVVEAFPLIAYTRTFTKAIEIAWYQLPVYVRRHEFYFAVYFVVTANLTAYKSRQDCVFAMVRVVTAHVHVDTSLNIVEIRLR